MIDFPPLPMIDPEALFVTRIFIATCACRETGLDPGGDGLEVDGDADDGGGDKLGDSVSSVVLMSSDFSPDFKIGWLCCSSSSSFAFKLFVTVSACRFE